MEEKQIIGLEAPKQLSAPTLTLAERKASLLRQGEFYRVGIVHAKAGIKQASRPDALFHSAVDHAGAAIRSRVDALLHPTGINMATVMPFAVTIFGFLRRRQLLKPALGVAAALAGAAYYLQHRHTKASY